MQSAAPEPPDGASPTPRPLRLRAHHALALLPAIGILGGVPFANRVRPFVFGLPFLLAYIVGWVLVTSAIMALVAAIDRRAGVRQ